MCAGIITMRNSAVVHVPSSGAARHPMSLVMMHMPLLCSLRAKSLLS